MRKVLLLTSSFILGVGLLNGCSIFSQGKYFQLRKTNYDTISSFENDNFQAAMPALLRTCAANPPHLADFCAGLPHYQYASSEEIKTYIKSKLTPYITASHGKTKGTITGYYEPILTGTRIKTKSTQVPVYGVPENYKNGKTYPTRANIEKKGINAPIIAWVDNPVDLFLLHVQGSGRINTPTGEIKVGYAGNNNRDFTGFGEILPKAGIKGLYSMPDIRAYLNKHPEKARDLMRENDRFIFFKENTGQSPYGAANVVLTPQRSIAADNRYIPMHTIMWLETTSPNGTPIQKLVVAQDVGNAIKGGIRADYFWGLGEQAFQQAGKMKSPGRYYLLLPKK